MWSFRRILRHAIRSLCLLIRCLPRNKLCTNCPGCREGKHPQTRWRDGRCKGTRPPSAHSRTTTKHPHPHQAYSTAYITSRVKPIFRRSRWVIHAMPTCRGIRTPRQCTLPPPRSPPHVPGVPKVRRSSYATRPGKAANPVLTSRIRLTVVQPQLLHTWTVSTRRDYC